MPPEPFFLAGPAGPVFAIYHPPASGKASAAGGANLVFVPPFAEEMNQARRMAAAQAMRLAEAGVGVLLLDPYGTGDSAGDFADARWDIWLGDIGAALDWFEARGEAAAGIWGLRLGGLLAMTIAANRAGRVPHVLLWQPVLKGRAALTQFLRLRVAAGLSGKGPKDSTEALRRALNGGQTVEVAGYPLHPHLAAAIEAADMSALAVPKGCRILWIDVAASADAGPAPTSARLVERWRAHGAKVLFETVVGEPFWGVQSWLAPVLVPALWDRTLELWES